MSNHILNTLNNMNPNSRTGDNVSVPDSILTQNPNTEKERNAANDVANTPTVTSTAFDPVAWHKAAYGKDAENTSEPDVSEHSDPRTESTVTSTTASSLDETVKCEPVQMESNPSEPEHTSASAQTMPIEPNDTINAKLNEINNLIAPYKLAYVHPANDCVLLDRNARYMTKEQQERLNENIKRDGFLSQLPFGIKQPNGKYKIISGNHRIKAAIKTNLPAVLLLYGEEADFDQQRQIAIQLSHNAVTGQDDPMLLKALYMELDDLAAKIYTGIDERALIGYKPLDLASIAEKDIELAEVRFMFSEADRERVLKLLDGLENYLGIEPANQSRLYKDSILFMEQDWFIDTMSKIQKKYQIKNRSTAMLKMCGIIEETLKTK